MRARTNLSTKERQSFSISDFRGVDFSSSPLRVASGRAIDMTNWICENGTNRKRHGWRQVCEKLDGQINGIFPYSHEGSTALLVYAGTTFYKIEERGGAYTKSTVTVEEGLALADRRIEAFWKNNGFFLVGAGGLYRFGADTDWTVKHVDPYVPTTTVNIDDRDVTDPQRAAFEPVNLLTARRKNTLVGREQETETETETGTKSEWLSYLLDSYIAKEDVTVEIVTEDGDGVQETELILKYNSDTRTHSYTDGEGEIAYIINHPFYASAMIKFNKSYKPPIQGNANITVEFTAARAPLKEMDVKDRIHNCRFGTLFGIGGYDDRLFLSGNPDYPSVVFFSETDDFTYFPDTFTAVMGEGDGAITGFLRLGDDTLATFKQGACGEAHVYYQTGEYRSTYDADGNLKKITPVFSICAGATGECAVNPYTSVHLAGENLMLSKNGVFAITPYENVATDMRVAQERSMAIRSRLVEQPSLSEAVGISYRGRYYLSMDGVCYVADSRYRYTDADTGRMQYEWYFWDNIPARVWAVVEDVLWFGTADGRLCCFDGEYTDRTYEEGRDGDFTMDVTTDRVTYNGTAYAPQENDLYEIRTEGAYAAICTIRLENGVAAVDADDMERVIEGETVYLADGEGNVSVFAFTVADVDRINATFSLVGKGIEGMAGEYLLAYPISGRTMYVTDVDGSKKEFALKKTVDSPAMDIVALPTNPIIWFYNRANVVARWCTPYFHMGTDSAAKTLLSLTLSALPEMGGELYFGYETAKSARQFRLQGTGVFSFENLDFYNFSFDAGFQNSHTVRARERNFNYILFRMQSDSDGPCSICSLTAVYKINKRNRGGDVI